MKKRQVAIWFLLGFGLNLFLALNRHSHGPKFNYHSELWADRAGYFVYLPAAFHYSFNPAKVEAGLAGQLGSGFYQDSIPGVILTKYTCGVAILQAPVYLLAQAYRSIAGIIYEPFDPIDHIVVDLAGALYLSTGLLLLFGFLKTRVAWRVALVTTVVVFAGSNLFFYGIADPGMSHVYSFFLFCATLNLLGRIDESTQIMAPASLFALGSLVGLIILIRPTNIVFIACVCGVLPKALPTILRSVKSFAGWAAVLLPVGVIAALQIGYWQYAFGQPLPWSYRGEGFSSWANPRLAEFWLSTNNGLVPYAPVILLALFGAILMLAHGKRREGWSMLVALATVSYLGASWWAWHFGCGFGSRTLVEYFALLGWPIAVAITWMIARIPKVAVGLVLATLVVYNLKLTYSYDSCWFGGTWDWPQFAELIFGPTK